MDNSEDYIDEPEQDKAPFDPQFEPCSFPNCTASVEFVDKQPRDEYGLQHLHFQGTCRDCKQPVIVHTEGGVWKDSGKPKFQQYELDRKRLHYRMCPAKQD